jgi:hypothetical protein
MAAVCFGVAVIGFAPTYWVPMVRGTLDVAPIAHVHAALFYGWTLLFLKQASLVASRRIARHREMGVLGVALAAAMLCVGLATAITSLKQGVDAGEGELARAFSTLPVTGILMFASFFAVAVLNVRNTEKHKRLMLLATISMLQAAVGRLFGFVLAPEVADGVRPLPPSVAATIPAGLASDLLIVVAMVYDWRAHGRVHPVYWIGGLTIVAVQILRAPLSSTWAWHAVTDWLLLFVP